MDASLLALNTGPEYPGQESKISLPCWAVLTSLPVFLSSLWASPPLLFSAQILVCKKGTRIVKFNATQQCAEMLLSLF